MKTLLFILFTSVSFVNFAQFTTESQVVSYMSGKEFYNESYGMKVSYEFIPKFNTYGIVCVNKNSEKFYYINCSVRPYGSSADINGMSTDGGGNFGFRVYNGKISVQGVDFFQVGKTVQNNSTTTTTNENSELMSKYFSNTASSPLGGPENIKKFQDWMDINYPGWVNGKSLKKGTGYGLWGPSTQIAYGNYGKQYNDYTLNELKKKYGY